MGSKHKELEVCDTLRAMTSVQLEMWWDSLHDWSAVMAEHVFNERQACKVRWLGCFLCERENRMDGALPRMEEKWIMSLLGGTVVGVF